MTSTYKGLRLKSNIKHFNEDHVLMHMHTLMRARTPSIHTPISSSVPHTYMIHTHTHTHTHTHKRACAVAQRGDHTTIPRAFFLSTLLPHFCIMQQRGRKAPYNNATFLFASSWNGTVRGPAVLKPAASACYLIKVKITAQIWQMCRSMFVLL